MNGLVLLMSTASATTWVGQDLGGADLVVADGDVVSGDFTGVGTFEVPSGVRVFVDVGVPLEVHADHIEILGILDGIGSGFAGGTLGDGEGPGGGRIGTPGPMGGAAGGGASFGGYGGRGGDQTTDHSKEIWSGGSAGSTYDWVGLPMGSGGASGWCGEKCLAIRPGGGGGASILLDASTTRIEGFVAVDGVDGSDYFEGTGAGGGGGSGGIVSLRVSTELSGSGHLLARGGAYGEGGIYAYGVGTYPGSGHGGGGYIVLTVPVLPVSVRLNVSGGLRRSSEGTDDGVVIERLFVDTDGDGCTDDEELSAGTDPDVADTDGDGVDDCVDPCPVDPGDDLDADGICDSQDTDADGDGVGAGQGDCNDRNAAVGPKQPEACNGIDDDCDGQLDEGCEDPTGPVEPIRTAERGSGCQCRSSGGSVLDGTLTAVFLGWGVGWRRRRTRTSTHQATTKPV